MIPSVKTPQTTEPKLERTNHAGPRDSNAKDEVISNHHLERRFFRAGKCCEILRASTGFGDGGLADIFGGVLFMASNSTCSLFCGSSSLMCCRICLAMVITRTQCRIHPPLHRRCPAEPGSSMKCSTRHARKGRPETGCRTTAEMTAISMVHQWKSQPDGLARGSLLSMVA